MSDLKYCPECGGQHLEDAGSVFVEDGPYNGKCYANEQDCMRYLCLDCKCVFGALPEPMHCKCGNHVYGEVGVDCDEDEENEGKFLCQECMKGGPDE